MPSAEKDAGEIERLRAEVKHWKDHAEEAGRGFAQVCRDYARVSARNVQLVEQLEALQAQQAQLAGGELAALATAVTAARVTPPEEGDH